MRPAHQAELARGIAILALPLLGLCVLGLCCLCVLGLCGCEPAYVATAVPKDAKFDVTCAGGCGVSGRDAGLIVDVTVLGSYSRQVSVCCSQRSALRARLQTARDHWCDGLDAPDAKVGDITIGTTVSQATGKRGITLDQGSGYVAFNCDDWLDELITKLEKTDCCDPDVTDPSRR
jgi:hypothetical protein